MALPADAENRPTGPVTNATLFSKCNMNIGGILLTVENGTFYIEKEGLGIIKLKRRYHYEGND